MYKTAKEAMSIFEERAEKSKKAYAVIKNPVGASEYIEHLQDQNRELKKMLREIIDFAEQNGELSRDYNWELLKESAGKIQ